jgi:hypothetical protein
MVNSAYKNALYASPSRASPPCLVWIHRQRPQDFDAIAILQGALGRNPPAENSQLQPGRSQPVAREHAALGDCLAGDGTFGQLDDREVLAFGQGIDHFNAHGG